MMSTKLSIISSTVQRTIDSKDSAHVFKTSFIAKGVHQF